MDDQRKLNPKFKFPEIQTASTGSLIPDLREASLLNNQERRPIPFRISTLNLYWQALQTPIAKIGLMILFLAFILILTPVPTPLLWIGRGGMLVGTILIGFSLFNSRSNSVYSTQHNMRDERLDDRFDYT